MARILLIVIWIALTIYAVADWARTPENEIPGRIPKHMWLVIIIFTAPTFSIGAIVWIVLRLVAAAEAGSSSGSAGPTGPSSGGGAPGPLPSLTDIFSGMPGRKSSPGKSGAPDDDPDFLFQLQREIHRKRTEEAKKAAGAQRSPGSDGSRSTHGSTSSSSSRDEGGAPAEKTTGADSDANADAPTDNANSDVQDDRQVSTDSGRADSQWPPSPEDPLPGDSDQHLGPQEPQE